MLTLSKEAARKMGLAKSGDAPGSKRKGLKYRNVPVTVDGHRFDSTAEATHWGRLRLLERIGEVRALRRQVSYDLLGVGGVVVGRYVADFVMEARQPDGSWVERIEDVKSAPTMRRPDYKLKKRLMAAMGHPIVEVI